MIGRRLQQLRLARGLSLDALAAELGGIVTKQSLSKYEVGKSQPSPKVLAALAETFGLKAADLAREPEIRVELPGYRKAAGLPKREQSRLECLVMEEMGRRVRLQELIGAAETDLPVQEYTVGTMDDIEHAAVAVRRKWDLGLGPVAFLIEALESHGVHVIEVDAPKGFDGISAIAFDAAGKLKGAGAVTRRSIGGERQRFNVAHELGHLVLEVSEAIEEEAAAHRFAGAFLAPAESIRREFGARRAHIQLVELQDIRRRYGLSMQASIRRLRDLEIVSESTYKQWCINFSKWGWRRQEPGESAPEEPQWQRRAVLRAVVEGQMTAVEAESLVDVKLEQSVPLSLIEKRNFISLPLVERRRILEQQAKHVALEYDERNEYDDIQGGDIVED